MSTQRNLTEFGGASLPDADAAPAWTPGGDRSITACQSCGEHVSTQFRRVNGDDSGRVFGCPNCCSKSELLRGAYREGEGGELHGSIREAQR